jgi:hypothetical protein
MAIRLRLLSDDESAAVRRLARSRTAPARLVERAEMICRAAAGEAMGAMVVRQRTPPRRWARYLLPR